MNGWKENIEIRPVPVLQVLFHKTSIYKNILFHCVLRLLETPKLYLGVSKLSTNIDGKYKPGVVAHAFNPSTQEAEATSL